MNRVNERNHSVFDCFFMKISNENPKIPLAWAVNAKNTFPMFRGYSSFQLVFVKNLQLANIMADKLLALSSVTTSKSVDVHIKGLYSGRKTFAEAGKVIFLRH